MRFPNEFIEQVRSASDLVALAGAATRLRRAGRSWKGLCPFHGEKTPSFNVSAERQMYFCFGCGKGGNAITFVMELERVAFPEAVRTLATRAGLAVPEMESGTDDSSRLRRLRDLHTFAAGYFRERLRSAEGEAARAYLNGRGLSDDSVERFSMGWAPDSWDGLLRAAAAAGFEPASLVEGGLATERSAGGGHYDRFRGRLIFPIADPGGGVIAFGGRRIAEDPESPKYLNSPETPLYVKGRTLYALHLAREAIRASGRLLVVEGYVDAVMMHAHGFRETVAALGTALTDAQVSLLGRHADQAVLVFDGDRAGVEAAIRGTDVLAGSPVRAQVVLLEGAKDPDELLRREGRDGFLRCLEAAQDVFEFRLGRELSGLTSNDLPSRLAAARSFLPWFARLRSPLDQSAYLQRLAERLRLPETELRNELRLVRTAARRQAPEAPSVEAAEPRAASPALERLEDEVLSWLIDDAAIAPGTGLVDEDFGGPGAKALFRRLMEEGAAAEPSEESAEEAAARARALFGERIFPDGAAAISELRRVSDRRRDQQRLDALRDALAERPESDAALLTEYQMLARRMKSSPASATA